MRILPYELYQYTPDLSLCALRKEFGMYDYCLNMNVRNKAMQPFLDMGRDYFNLLINKWLAEMHKRKLYVNTFHSFYAKNMIYQNQKTPFFLILECCIQWEIKDFKPYKTDFKWFDIVIKLLENHQNLIVNLNFDDYNQLIEWYRNSFMKLNKKNKLKPNNLDMLKFVTFFNNFVK